MRRLLKTLISLLCILSLTSCSGGGTDGNGTEPVRLRLKWLYNASFAGEIWGVETGLFHREGLAVSLLEGGPEQDAIKDLELGRAEFGIASGDQVIRAASKGAEVVVLAQVFQRNPLRWIYSRKRLGYLRPEGLAGLTVGVTFGGNDEAIFAALLNRASLPAGRVKIYGVHYDFSPFWKGQVDLWPVYYNTQGIVIADKMRRNGDEPGFLDPDRWGVRFVANSLVTSRRLAEEKPELVRRFTRAFVKAWREAMDEANAERLGSILARYEKGVSPRLIARQIEATRELVAPRSGKGWCEVDRDAWRQTLESMSAAGLVKAGIGLDGLLAPALP